LRLLFPAIPEMLLTDFILLSTNDTDIIIADTGIPHNKTTTGQTKASNSCAIAIIMDVWTTPSGEGGANGV
jgi:hypothetical protein